MAKTSYAIALGANRYRHGPPHRAIARAFDVLEDEGIAVLARSRIIASRPLGPGRRNYANAAAVVETPLDPPGLLAKTKAIEIRFGRRPGRRWGDRPLDIDIILWSRGLWAHPQLVIPHPQFRARRFVLDPLVEIAPDWRDPVTGLDVRHLARRMASPIPVDRQPPRP